MAALPPEGLRLIELLAGLALVAGVLSDVFRTVVLPRATGRTVRLGPLVGRVLLAVWLAWLGRKAGRRRASLGALGPLLIVAELLIWVLLLIFGYGLLLHATQGLRPRDTLADSLYAAASAFVTTGLSGQEATTGAARLVIAATGFSGLAIVTLVVTFLLSVQTVLLRREEMVLRLRARVGEAPSGVLLLETLSRIGAGRDKALPDYFTGWEAWAADVLLTHRAYPILVYFRSTDEDCGWMAALGAVLDASALLAVMRHEDAGEHALVCHRMGTRLVRDLARQLKVRVPQGAGLDRAAFDEALERLKRAGYLIEQDPALLWPAFERLRAEHWQPLRAMTDRFGESAASW